MKQLILGTAGHIDHGKTSLIKALTGTNTDRLKEEQKRGITIELGFAALDLPDGRRIGIVDVPGHEKFVKNMVAGASGIDLVVMVIAADEGVMPQTREHMEICTLLGIDHGFIALTKTDMVDEEWLELVTEDVKDFMQGTFLEDAPIVPVSSVKGTGLKEFTRVLGTMTAAIPERSPSGLFRLPVDRVFTMRGFGTVITGTLISGSVKVGDTIMIYPSNVTSKVRGIQFHNQAVEEAHAGMRTAINFQGLEKTAIQRGEVLSMPGSLIPAYMTDIKLNYLASNAKPIKTRTRVRFHTGTSEVLGNLILLESDDLPSGSVTNAQIRLDEPVALVKDDRFVIRSYSPVRTIGGGRVLNPAAPKHKRFKTDVIEGLKTLADGSEDDMISYHTKLAGYKGVSLSELKIMGNLGEKKLSTLLQGLMTQQMIIQTDKENRIFIHSDRLNALKDEISARLQTFHEKYPLKTGMSKEELKSRLPAAVSIKLFNFVFNQLLKQDRIMQDGDIVRLSSHKVSLKADQADIKEKILKTFVESGLTPPYFKDVCKTFDMEADRASDVLRVLMDEGKIVKVKEDLYFHTAAIDALELKIRDFFDTHDEMAAPQFKELTGLSRKYMIPLLEHMDAKNVTIRVGDIRKRRR